MSDGLEDGPYLELFEDKRRKWRFRLRAANHQKVMTSGEAYHSKSNAYRAAMTVANWFQARDYVPVVMWVDEERRIIS